MIINVHGFRGEGNNSKYRWLCENIPRHEIYSPTLSYGDDPANILDHLLNKISSYYRNNPDGGMGVYVVGNSLGGFYARIINQLYPGVRALLVNPSLTPFLTLREYLRENMCRRYLDMLARYAYSDEYGNHKNLYVIIGGADERIDHQRATIPLLPPGLKNLYIICDGKHRLNMTPEVAGIFRYIIEVPEGRSDGELEPIRYCGKRKLP